MVGRASSPGGSTLDWRVWRMECMRQVGTRAATGRVEPRRRASEGDVLERTARRAGSARGRGLVTGGGLVTGRELVTDVARVAWARLREARTGRGRARRPGVRKLGACARRPGGAEAGR